MAELKFNVLERIIQVEGHLYKYEPSGDFNILIKENLFLCIDKVQKPLGPHGADWTYLINVID